jgi:hypothetical protein
MHLEAREAVEKARSSGEQPRTPLRVDELDRLSGMTSTRRERAPAVAPTPVMPDRLAADYRAISGLDAPMAASRSRHSSADSYAPPDPRLVEQMEMVRSGASTPNGAFRGEEEEEFGVVGPVRGAAVSRGASPRQSYILDASWEDFVAQLGF